MSVLRVSVASTFVVRRDGLSRSCSRFGIYA